MRLNSSGTRSGRTILLAPPLTRKIGVFDSIQGNCFRHRSLLAEAQRLRGRLYLQDGAIGVQQLSDGGRLVHELDRQSWHVLSMDLNGRVAGCLRYSPRDHVTSFSELEVARSPVARSAEWGAWLTTTVEGIRAQARRRGIGYVEVGGWALTKEMRGSAGEALRMLFAIYGLAQLLGDALVITTATRRHHSAAILRKIGGKRLFTDGIELPSYYDPYYDCEMEILAFDSRNPNPKYEAPIDECRQHLKNVTVISADSVYPDWGISETWLPIRPFPTALGPVLQEAGNR